jgi:hypothetical protein
MESKHSEINQDDLLSPEELTEKYGQEIADYFEISVDETIRPVIFTTWRDLADEYEAQTKRKAPPFLKDYVPFGAEYNEPRLLKWGAADNNGRVRTREEFNKSLKHELIHIYQQLFSIANGHEITKTPFWLMEGVALQMAGQETKRTDETTLDRLRNLDGMDEDIYPVGNKVVSEILKNYGKAKLLELCLIDDTDQIYAELQKMFDWLK